MVSFTYTAPHDVEMVPDLYVGGTILNPIVVEAFSGIHITQSDREYQYVVGDGPTDLSTVDPQIDPGLRVGQELILRGTSDTNFVMLHNGRGVSLNGVCVLESGSVIYLVWDGELWNEVMRNDV